MYDDKSNKLPRVKLNIKGLDDACNCSPKCCAWFNPLVAGVIVTFGVLAFVFGIWAFYTAQFTTSFSQYSASVQLSPQPSSHLIVGDSIITITLPNNLVEFVGKTYNIDCGTMFPHKIKLAAGSPQIKWDGVNTLATCAGAGSGFTFHVVSPFYLRIIGTPVGIMFSL